MMINWDQVESHARDEDEEGIRLMDVDDIRAHRSDITKSSAVNWHRAAESAREEVEDIIAKYLREEKFRKAAGGVNGYGPGFQLTYFNAGQRALYQTADSRVTHASIRPYLEEYLASNGYSYEWDSDFDELAIRRQVEIKLPQETLSWEIDVSSPSPH